MDVLKYISFALFVFCFSVNTAFAQDGLKPEEIEVVSDFNAVVADAVKVNFPATLPDRKASEKLELVYETPAEVLTMPFAPSPLKPIAIGKEKPEKFPMSYFKVGFGTQLSPLFESLWNDGKYEKYNYGAFFRHFSARGSKIDHQDFYTNQVSIFGNYFTKKMKLNAEANYKRDGMRFYGYDHADTSFTKEQVLQHYDDFVFSTGLTNIKNLHEFNYKATLDFGFYGDRFDRNEFYFRGATQMEKIFKKKHIVTLDLMEDYSVFNTENLNAVTIPVPLNRNLFGVKPVYEFNDRVWLVAVGGHLIWENKTFHIFPEFRMERSLWDQYIVMFNGLRMDLDKTSFKSLTEENPWLGETFELKNTWYEESNIGLKGTVQDFSYNVRFVQRLARKLPLFVNDLDDPRRFEVVYDVKTHILSFQTEFFYHINKDWNTSLTIDYSHFEMDEVAKPWHLPNFKIDFNTQYNIKKKVYLTLDLLVRDGVDALLPENEVLHLKPTADINLGATYKFSKHFSFFCNLDRKSVV